MNEWTFLKLLLWIRLWGPCGDQLRQGVCSRGICNPVLKGWTYKQESLQDELSELRWIPTLLWASLVAQMVKNPPAIWETWVWSLGWEDPLEKGMATHSSILAWEILRTAEPGGLQSVRSHDSSDLAQMQLPSQRSWLADRARIGPRTWRSGEGDILEVVLT